MADVPYDSALIEKRAAQTSDCAELLKALPPLADTVRYGQARATDAAQLETLLTRIVVQGALALPYAARGVSRMTLDDRLFRAAVHKGATPVTETVTSLDSIRARVIAGAWGR